MIHAEWKNLGCLLKATLDVALPACVLAVQQRRALGMPARLLERVQGQCSMALGGRNSLPVPLLVCCTPCMHPPPLTYRGLVQAPWASRFFYRAKHR